MSFRKALVAATMLALPLAANAQPVTGLYVGGSGGVDIMQSEHAQVFSPTGRASGNLNTRVGPAGALEFGYGLGNGLRVEIEGNYLRNNFGNSSGLTNSGGLEQKFGGTLNVLYDFVGLVPYVQPYVGVGAGYEWAKDSNLHAAGPGFTAAASTKTIGKFAYQGIVGVAYPIASVPNLALTADYHFLGMLGDRDYSGVINGTPGTLRLNRDYNHIIMVGLRWNFGAPPPPSPAPAPAAVAPSPVSRSYLVFFDWDKATLTERARQIVSEAAANSTKVQYTRLEVNGYTDTSGTARYNQRLSVRRAEAVAAELVKDGVPKSAIAIQGFGETHLLVPTGQGVREPQNRRVEIIIQ